MIQRNQAVSRTLLGMVCLAGSVLMLDGVALEPGATASTTLRDVLTVKLAKQESDLHAMIMAMQKRSTAGAGATLRGRQRNMISKEQAITAALQKNLTLLSSKLDRKIVSEAVKEIRAVFDPQFLLSWGFRRLKTYGRTVTGTVVLKKFVPIAAVGLDILPTELPQISAIGFRAQIEEETVTRQIPVSKEQFNGAEQPMTYTIGIDQQLPWGVTLNLATVATDQEVYYNGRGGSYGASWSSNVSFTLDMPLPFSRNFGSASALDTQLKLARQTKSRSYWQVTAAINDTLLAVDGAFWDLVQALEELAIGQENLELATVQAARSERLFKAGSTTNYKKAIVDGQLSRARSEEEAARQAYIAASLRLAILVDDDPKAVEQSLYLPYGYVHSFDSTLRLQSKMALQNAWRNRPEMHIEKVNLAIGNINLNAAKNQARPDLRFNANHSTAQNGAQYGYKSYFKSVQNYYNPDTRSQSYAVDYRYPWLQQQARARVSSEQSGLQDAKLVQMQVKITVARDVYDALARFSSAEQALKLAKSNLVFTQTAYERLDRRRRDGAAVNVNELVESLRELNRAKLAVLRQKINRKRSEAALLYAQGSLGKRFVKDISRTPFEKYRLALLHRRGLLKFFSP